MPSCLFDCAPRINEPTRLLDWRKGSHFPPEGRGAGSPDVGRGNLRTKCEYPSAQNGQSGRLSLQLNVQSSPAISRKRLAILPIL